MLSAVREKAGKGAGLEEEISDTIFNFSHTKLKVFGETFRRCQICRCKAKEEAGRGMQNIVPINNCNAFQIF